MKLESNILQKFRKVGQIFLPLFLCLICSSAAALAQTPSATFKRMWIDYDVTENNQKGMRIHTEFDVHNMKGITGVYGLYFQYRNGTYLRDTNKKFYSVTGEVVVHTDLNPCCNPTTWYQDLALFMPYDELELAAGKYDLRILPLVLYKNGSGIGTFPTYDFVFTQPGTEIVKNPEATFTSAWVDYDIREAGRKGMRVHVKFSTANMKGIDGKLAIFFQKRGGDPLYSNSSFRATGQRVGEMVAYFSITPGFEKTDYSDLSVFIPYSEFKSVLPRGTHNLQMDIDVIYQNGTPISHLSTEDFWFEYK